MANRTFTARASGKVNVHLGCGWPRSDGYHDLVTIFQAVDLADEVSIELFDDSIGGIHGPLQVSGPTATGVPDDESNLVWKAIELVHQRFSELFPALVGLKQQPALRVAIVKNIPAAGGMAGGSADAAAALIAANAAFGAWYEKGDVAGSRKQEAPALDRETLRDLAAQLGADVPFCLLGGTALGTGRGDVLTPVLARGTFHWCFIASQEGLSTPKVFKKLDELRESASLAGDQQRLDALAPHLDTSAVSQAVTTGDCEQLARAMRNDLQAASFSLRPSLRTIIDLGQESGALRGMVSGSGPTIALLCPSAAIAREVRDIIVTEVPGTRGFVTTSPARGARLVDSNDWK
ncbi:MAG: 4-(cytidine 5'-diphospho)-2-C-methyl-D-erythritol kinase [Corynebacterium sp.]|nr:4-(cytidine 5'-diphospho)-2-C-methyl-D-erythritol kinase [Corynebacterium sp.]